MFLITLLNPLFPRGIWFSLDLCRSGFQPRSRQVAAGSLHLTTTTRNSRQNQFAVPCSPGVVERSLFYGMLYYLYIGKVYKRIKMMSTWHIWVIAAIILCIFEMLIPAFVLISLGLGCLVASIAAGLHLGVEIQIAAFIAGTLGAFFGVRPIFTKYCYKASPGVKTNVDALIGKIGRVTETINDELNTGRVLVGGDDWKAEARDGGIIDKNSKVEVVGVESSKIYVRPV